MMERENSNRSRRITLRLTDQEYTKIENKFKASTCRKISDHIRRQLFNKPIVATYRNQSLDDYMEEIIVLNSELRAIGNNVNQIAKKVNALKFLSEFKMQLFTFEIESKRLFDKMEEIRNHTKKLSEKWLQ